MAAANITGERALAQLRPGGYPWSEAPVQRPDLRVRRDGEGLRPTVSVVVPAMNEEDNLPHVLGVLPAGIDEVILVDGSSTDDTVAVARRLRPDIIVLNQTGKGKGNALACGFRAASKDIIVMIDADASMDPAEIPAMVAAVASGMSTYAKGSRLIDPGGSADLTVTRRLGNLLLLALVNRIYRTSYTDLCYGFIAFWRKDLEVLGFGIEAETSGATSRRRRSMGFEVETLLNVRAARVGLRVVEVPSYERARMYGTSNLHVVRDGLRVLRSIATERFRPVPFRSPGPAVVPHAGSRARRSMVPQPIPG